MHNHRIKGLHAATISLCFEILSGKRVRLITVAIKRHRIFKAFYYFHLSKLIHFLIRIPSVSVREESSGEFEVYVTPVSEPRFCASLFCC